MSSSYLQSQFYFTIYNSKDVHKLLDLFYISIYEEYANLKVIYNKLFFFLLVDVNRYENSYVFKVKKHDTKKFNIQRPQVSTAMLALCSKRCTSKFIKNAIQWLVHELLQDNTVFRWKKLANTSRNSNNKESERGREK